VEITASIGVSLFPGDGDDAEGLLKRAEAAMLQAKAQGGNRYRFYEPCLAADRAMTSVLESDLRDALEKGELMLLYQPRFALDTGRLVGAEALLRWNHTQLGVLSPIEFLPAAEESGVSLALGDWVLRTACVELRSWLAAAHARISLGVTLSPRQFRRDGLVDAVARALRDADLSAQHLELELSEACVMADADAAMATLIGLSRMGVRLVINDSGTGWSSLGHLRRFPIHKLKIDGSFVLSMVSGPDDAAVAASTVALAHSMGLRVVAQGVETREQQELLRRQGCDEGQGLFFGRPVVAADFERRWGWEPESRRVEGNL